MKKMNLKLLTAIVFALMLVFVTSCKKDKDEETIDYKPVLKKNFDYTISGQVVSFTTTIPGNVWFTLYGDAKIDYPAVDKKVDVTLSKKGTYKFTCSSLGSGATLTSDTFNIEMTTSDLTFLNKGMWKLLTGGEGKSKTWVLDIDANSVVTDLWGAPVAYSGKDGSTPETGGWFYWDYIPTDRYDQSYINWAPEYKGNEWLMAAKNYGTMTFSANDQTVTTVRPVENITSETGSFTFDTVTWKLTFNGTVIVRDSGRIADVDDWQNYRIFYLTDSALQIGVKRVRNDKEWVVLYNYITKTYKDNYVPPAPVVYTQPVKTTFAKADLVGTWKFEIPGVPFDWIGWKTANRLNAFADTAAIVATGWAATSAQLIAAGTQTFVFNNDGTCTLNGVANTYTVADGKITFGTALGADDMKLNYIALAGTEIYAIDVKFNNDNTPYTGVGIWLGQRNGTKEESMCLHLIKQ
jgi:hypothetical protein